MNPVDKYILSFPDQVQALLNEIRSVIKKYAPLAEEGINYGIVGYKQNGKPLVYFGAFKHHIGFYATPNGHEHFKKELLKFKQGKGSVQFPINKPLPLELISEIVVFRVKQTSNKF